MSERAKTITPGYYGLTEYGSGYVVVQLLEFLYGLPLTDLTLSYIYALRPSSVEVGTGGRTMDAQYNRIRVLVTNDGIIRRIEMELAVPLFREGITSGCALDQALARLRKEMEIRDEHRKGR